ncbi:MAG: hypothetical protein WC840_02200 [Candidatus Peribacteraceae bacterium]
MDSRDSQVVLVPKGALTEARECRNSLVDLLVRSGYDRIRNGLDRHDEIMQGDFTFRGIKGADALAVQLERFSGEPVGILMGSDVLAEADFTAAVNGVRSDIGKILSLDIGPCRLVFLAPVERPIRLPADLDNRTIFSKYPQIVTRLLGSLNRRAAMRRSEGADTRVGEWRDRDDVAAFEIVGSGETARSNGLQIVENELEYPSGDTLGASYLDLRNVSTDMFVTQFRTISGRSREALRELGLALESARASNQYVSFSFNVPADQVERFLDLGMHGPTVSPVLSRDGRQWSAVGIHVPVENKNHMRAELLRRGAQDLSMSAVLHVEVAPERSEVLAALPFELPPSMNTGDTVSKAGDRSRSDVACWMLDLSATVESRQPDPLSTSSTSKALAQGREFCVARYVGEVAELSKALRTGNRDEIIAEAGQCVYWLLVALRSREMTFGSVIRKAMKTAVRQDDVPDSDFQLLLSKFLVATEHEVQSQTPFPMPGSQAALAAIDLVDQSTVFSTALRKRETDEAAEEAMGALRRLVRCLKLAGVGLNEVMQAERG